MAVRRKKESRSKAYGGGRGGPGCLSFLLLVLFVLAAVAATIAIFFKISRIEVVGNERYTPDEIRSASGIEEGDNLLLFNKFGAIGGIFAQLPYIDEIRMTRDLPDTLLITVTECDAAAYLGTDGSFWLLSDAGKLLEQRTKPPDTPLIEILGATLVDPVLGETANLGVEADGAEDLRTGTLIDTMSAITAAAIGADVKSIDVSKIYNVEFTYLGRFTVKLGMPEELDYKLKALKEEIVIQLESNQNGVIDLSELVDKGIARFIPYNEISPTG